MAATDDDTAPGNPDQLRSAGRSWLREATSYDDQNRQLQRVSSTLPASAFTGARGDQVRLYLSDTIKSTSALTAAYRQLSLAAPQVADAIQDAKDAKKRKDDAQRDVADAQRDLADALADVAVAAAEVTATATRDLLTHGHSQARAQQHLRTAEQRASRAKTDLDGKQQRLTKARTEFTHAQQERKRLSGVFKHLLESQTDVINRTLPTAPPAPSVSPVLSELSVLGYGRQAVKGLLDLQEKAIRTHYGVPERLSLRELRAIRDGSGQSLGRLLQLGRAKLGPLTETQSRDLAAIEKWSGRVGRVNTLLSGGITLASKTVEALHDPHLSAQQKQDQIVNRFLLEFGGGVAGAAACSPGIVSSTACGYAGSQVGRALEKSRVIRRFTDGYSHISINPYVEVGDDVVHGRVLETAKDAALIPARVGYNLVTQTFPTRKRLDGIRDDVVHDVTGAAKVIKKNSVLTGGPILVP